MCYMRAQSGREFVTDQERINEQVDQVQAEQFSKAKYTLEEGV